MLTDLAEAPDIISRGKGVDLLVYELVLDSTFAGVILRHLAAITNFGCQHNSSYFC